MSSPAPSDDKGVLPWIIQPGTYQWVDDIFNTALKQWGVIFACIILCICCVIILMVVASGKPKEQSFGNVMKESMQKKLMDLAL